MIKNIVISVVIIALVYIDFVLVSINSKQKGSRYDYKDN
jgi:hypothetical protein